MTSSEIRSHIEAISIEGLRKIAFESIDPQFDPIEQAMQTPLDDRTYYGICLAQRLTHALSLKEESANQLISNPEALQQAWLLVEQAYHLIANGRSEPLARSDRQKRYGDDDYIANLIVILQTPADERQVFGNPTATEFWNDLLWRIGTNANVFPGTEKLDLEKRQKVLTFIRDRFGIALSHPDAIPAAAQVESALNSRVESAIAKALLNLGRQYFPHLTWEAEIDFECNLHSVTGTSPITDGTLNLPSIFVVIGSAQPEQEWVFQISVYFKGTVLIREKEQQPLSLVEEDLATLKRTFFQEFSSFL